MLKVPPERCESVFDHFEESVKARPDHTALVYGQDSVTFSELHDRVLFCAENLKVFGLTNAHCCMISVPNSIEAAIATLAVWKIGAVLVLVNDLSPDNHLQHALKKTEPQVLVIKESEFHRVTGSEKVHLADPVKLCREKLTGRNTVNDNHKVDLHAGTGTSRNEQASIASVLFTSGTTGSPKGVMQSHRTLVSCCYNVANSLNLSENDSVLCPVPWSFDYGFGQLLSTVILGITQVVPSAANAFEICASIERWSPTVFAGVPSVFASMLLGVSPVDQTDLSSIRLVTNTGSRVPDTVTKRLFECFYQAEFSFNYGLTETYRTSSLPTKLAKTDSNSVGFSIPGVEVTVVREDGSRASTNEIGEIVHTGEGVFLGYWGDDINSDATRKLYSSRNHSGCETYSVFTGDLGYVDDQGLLYITGRRDRQIKCMGVRVNPAEIEASLLLNPNIAMAAVVPKKHDMYGEMVVAMLVAISEPDTTLAEVIRQLKYQCKKCMSPFMMPRKYIFIDSMPLTANGKVNYLALARSVD